MEPNRFDHLVRALAAPSRRRFVTALTAVSALVLAADANEGFARNGKNKKKNKMKNKKKGKNKKGKNTPPPLVQQDIPCSPDPHCGDEGECRNGVCFCPTREQFCGGTCCSPLWFGQEVCVDDRICCHPTAACGNECCPGNDECLDGACCPDRRVCYGAEVGRRICCGPDEWCVSPAGMPAESTCCPAARVCHSADDWGECCNPDQTCCDGRCCAADETCVGDETGRRCCPTARVCDSTCCDVANACVDGQCCDRAALTIRNETCCPSGSGNNYVCGRFTCHQYLTGSGPGGCDLWCDSSEEGSLCGPDVEGIPTGEGNGRECCCIEPGTSTCLWP